MKTLKIASWNINSVRLRKLSVIRFLKESDIDVLCLQETKVPDMLFPEKDFRAAGYPYIAFKGMKSYNGVAIISRLPFLAKQSLSFCGKEDCRHISVSLEGDVELHNFYVPAGGDVPNPAQNEKFAHKLAFIDEMTAWFPKNRTKGKKIILLGDLNIAPDPFDVWSHNQLLNVVSHTEVEIDKLGRLQKSFDWIDIARHLNPSPQRLYSWWSYRARDWQASNRGRRLDHIWVTPALLPQLEDFEIFTEWRGIESPSDHVPVKIGFQK